MEITKKYLNELTLNMGHNSNESTGLWLRLSEFAEDWHAIYENGGLLHTVVATPDAIQRLIPRLLDCQIAELGDAQYESRIRTPLDVEIDHKPRNPDTTWIEIKLMLPFPHWVKFVTSRYAITEIFMIGGDVLGQSRKRWWRKGHEPR